MSLSPRILRAVTLSFFTSLIVFASLNAQTTADLPSAPKAAAVTLNGTVEDINGDLIPDSTITLEDTTSNQTKQATADTNGFFHFFELTAGDTYRVTVSAKGFDDWHSELITPTAGQFVDVPNIKLKLALSQQSILVTADTTQIATEQVYLEEQQRVLGIIPNFYVVYDVQDAVPMTAKLKFKLALRTSIDPVTFIGMGFISTIDQAADTPNYQQGWLGFGQRFGANYTDTFTDVLFGGAILPSIFHQDPRYYYQGTGSTASRVRHAALAPFLCRGDNGKTQFNISSLGGDLISGSISQSYYPSSNRGAGLLFETFSISTAARIANTLAQEFIFSKLTTHGKKQN